MAEVGSIIHRLLEMAIRGQIDHNGDPTFRVKQVFEELLKSAQHIKRLIIIWT